MSTKSKRQATSPIRSGFSQHKQAFTHSLAHLWQNPISTWITLAAIAIALSLPAGLYILLGNLKTLTDDKRGRGQYLLSKTVKAQQSGY